MIRGVYSRMAERVDTARTVVGKPLTLAEKILYNHLWDGKAETAFARGKDYVDFAPDRIACQDAVELLRKRIPGDSLAGVRIYFPDPWPKKRHHKRRIIQAPFIALLEQKMQAGSILHLATDWAPYGRAGSRSAKFRSATPGRAPRSKRTMRPTA